MSSDNRVFLLGYPKSGNRFLIYLLRESGYEVINTHSVSRAAKFERLDLHIMRDPKDIVISAISYFIYRRPVRDPKLLRSHVEDVARGIARGKLYNPEPYLSYIEKAKSMARKTLRYEDLLRDPVGVMASFGYDVKVGAEKSKILDSGSKDERWTATGFRSGTPGDWKRVCTQEQQELLLRLFQSKV